MSEQYHKYWTTIVESDDQPKALVDHFHFLATTPAMLALLEEVCTRCTAVTISDDRLLIDFENGFQLQCRQPAEYLLAGVPASYAALAAVHNGLQLQQPHDVPVFFGGTGEGGALFGAELIDEETEFFQELQQANRDPRPVGQAMMHGQHEVIFHPFKVNGITGEPVLCYIDHENGIPCDLPTGDLLFAQVFFILVAEAILQRPLLNSFAGETVFVEIGKHRYLRSATRIRIADEEIGVLPAAIGHMEALRELVLIRCHLHTLPPETGMLTCLQKLVLPGNRLTGIPETIGELAQLIQLDLSENAITVLPNSLGALPMLQELRLESNPLTFLPDTLGNLHSLMMLSIESNQLTTLPAGLAQLASLKTLFIKGTQLTVVPEWVGALNSLEELSLIDNKQLRALPPSLGRLTQLRTLCLNNCEQLQSIPATLATLEWLQHFEGNNTAIDSKALENICQARALTKLELNNAAVTHIPPAIRQLQQLQQLSLQENPLVTLAPETGELKNLAVLNLDDCALHSIPPEIGNLQQLNSCSLGLSSSAELPDELGALSELEFLAIDNSALAGIPTWIGQLPALRVLSLKGWTALSSLDETMVRCRSLSRLWIMNCPAFSELPAGMGTLDKLRDVVLRNTNAGETAFIILAGCPALQELEFSGSALQHVPLRAGELNNLLTLNLSRNAIGRLSPVIKELPKLWSLDLSDNNLTMIMPDIFRIQKLHTLNLSANPLETIPGEIEQAQRLRKLFLHDCHRLPESTFSSLQERLPVCEIVWQK